MVSINFYHLTFTSLDIALPKLLEKIFSSGSRCLLLADSDERIEQLDKLLWTYDAGSFLPHGTEREKEVEFLPILLSTTITNINNAGFLLVTDGRMVDDVSRFERIFDIFDGKNMASVESARNRWKKYKDTGYEISYYKQDERGVWQKAA